MLPTPVAREPALEICNTVAGWDQPTGDRVEYLDTYETLVVWATAVGLLTRDQASAVRHEADPDARKRVLARTRWFRTNFQAAVTGPGHEGSLATIVDWAREIAPARGLDVDGGRLRPIVAPEHPRDLPLVATVAAGVDFLAGDHSRVGSCPPGAGSRV